MKYSFILKSCRLRSYLMLNRLRYCFSRRPRHHINFTHVLQIIAARAKSTPFFVQIGAFDGKSNDPLFEMIRTRKWQGLLVEPVCTHFETLKENYREFENLVFENVAVSDSSGEFEFYQLPPVFSDPPWLKQIGSFSREAIEKNLKDCFPQYIEKISSTMVRAVTLEDLLTKACVNRIDVMVIDVEGHEDKVLDRIEELAPKPKVILFEEGCMSELSLESLLGKLDRASYRVYSTGTDLLAIHPSALNEF